VQAANRTYLQREPRLVPALGALIKKWGRKREIIGRARSHQWGRKTSVAGMEQAVIPKVKPFLVALEGGELGARPNITGLRSR